MLHINICSVYPGQAPMYSQAWSIEDRTNGGAFPFKLPTKSSRCVRFRRGLSVCEEVVTAMQ
ncbi:hypothetical protein BD626DRAFT_496444 [Schizophyllum amplum]|uniref:Uncharacterized protein n=1 Tax=Schizophyllum amplum TaxID=97359 RepID=A0A550CD89_9AGAR|nr:hypothetical protein BD626DRAFT_496444 [Auriculariopsis ampla]